MDIDLILIALAVGVWIYLGAVSGRDAKLMKEANKDDDSLEFYDE